MCKLLVLLLLSPLSAFTGASAQHVTESPQAIEGPQTPGKVPDKPAEAPIAPEPVLLSNDTILRMHTAGLSDDLIIQTIKAQPGRYETGPEALIRLREAGLSNDVLSAMSTNYRRPLLQRIPPGSTPFANTPIELSPVNEIGVYYKAQNGSWQRMESEVVHIKSGGFLKSTLTHNIIKEDRNGVVSGRESKLLLPRPCDFLIYTPEGVDGPEYDLLQFRLNSKDREFRTLTGGVIHSTGGAKRDEVPFAPVRIAPHTWAFTVPRDTPGGEYGILPPGTGNVTNGGKIYTFAISE